MTCDCKKRGGSCSCRSTSASSHPGSIQAAMYSLRDNADLMEFVLENVEHFGEERVLGTGSYGSVQEVSHCMLCFCALSLVLL